MFVIIIVIIIIIIIIMIIYIYIYIYSYVYIYIYSYVYIYIYIYMYIHNINVCFKLETPCFLNSLKPSTISHLDTGGHLGATLVIIYANGSAIRKHRQTSPARMKNPGSKNGVRRKCLQTKSSGFLGKVLAKSPKP